MDPIVVLHSIFIRFSDCVSDVSPTPALKSWGPLSINKAVRTKLIHLIDIILQSLASSNYLVYNNNPSNIH